MIFFAFDMNQKESKEDLLLTPRGDDCKKKRDSLLREIAANEGAVVSNPKKSCEIGEAHLYKEVKRPDFYYSSEHCEDLKNL